MELGPKAIITYCVSGGIFYLQLLCLHPVKEVLDCHSQLGHGVLVLKYIFLLYQHSTILHYLGGLGS